MTLTKNQLQLLSFLYFDKNFATSKTLADEEGEELLNVFQDGCGSKTKDSEHSVGNWSR